MSQHDYNIANQTFPATRTDLNNALGAIATNNAGNSAPSTTYANQWWFDSDGNQLYIRNKDNDAWVKVVTIGATSDKIDSIADSISIADAGGVTITVADNSDNLTLTTTDADGSIGPNLRLYRNSASPADNDDLSTIDFEGRNDASQDVQYGMIRAILKDASDGTEDGLLEFHHMKNGSLAPSLQIGPDECVINESSNDYDFRVESNSDTHMLFVDGGNNNVGIGTGTADARFHIMTNDASALLDANGDDLFIENTSSTGMTIGSSNSGEGHIRFSDSDDADVGAIGYFHGSNYLNVRVNAAERMRIDSNGKVLIGTTSEIQNFGDDRKSLSIRSTGSGHYGVLQISGNADSDDQLLGIVNFYNETTSCSRIDSARVSNTSDANLRFWTAPSSGGIAERARITSTGYLLVGKTAVGTAEGCSLHPEGQGQFIRDQGVPLVVMRNGDDGDVVKIQQAGSLEGTISVSGSTVSYNAFTGGHWSRLADNSKPTILRGTIMESIDEMCDWYQAVAEIAESTDDEGNVTPAQTVKESIALGDKSVGDAITFTSNGTEYTGTIVKEDDVKHNKCKVSDTADSKKVYGVFSNWDDADDGLDGDVNDMNIAQVGTFVIRVNADVTVEAGDLLVSNGDGTAKVQDDDIIRSKTVAKVNSTVKIETYADGSYTVPCTLHC